MREAKKNGVLGAVIIMVESVLSLISVLLQGERHMPIFFVPVFVVICDVLLIIGVFFLLAAFRKITSKLLMRDTENKFLYGFVMLGVTSALSIISFVVFSLGNAKWFSLIIASFFFIASILLVLALMRFGEAVGIIHFKVAAWLFIAMVIVPPYTGAGGLLTNFKNVHSILVATAMYSLGDVILFFASIFFLLGFTKLDTTFSRVE